MAATEGREGTYLGSLDQTVLRREHYFAVAGTAMAAVAVEAALRTAAACHPQVESGFEVKRVDDDPNLAWGRIDFALRPPAPHDVVVKIFDDAASFLRAALAASGDSSRLVQMNDALTKAFRRDV